MGQSGGMAEGDLRGPHTSPQVADCPSFPEAKDSRGTRGCSTSGAVGAVPLAAAERPGGRLRSPRCRGAQVAGSDAAGLWTLREEPAAHSGPLALLLGDQAAAGQGRTAGLSPGFPGREAWRGERAVAARDELTPGRPRPLPATARRSAAPFTIKAPHIGPSSRPYAQARSGGWAR